MPSVRWNGQPGNTDSPVLPTMDPEVAVLGGILTEPETIQTVSNVLKPTHFDNRVHRTIYETVLELSRDEIPLDRVTLVNKLNPKLEGVRTRLSKLLDSVATTAHIGHHAKRVVSDHTRREASRRLAVQSRTLKRAAKNVVTHPEMAMLSRFPQFLTVLANRNPAREMD